MGMIQEFRTFIYRGNAIDLAVGVIIGAAFGKIVSALVGSVLMPVLGLVMGGIELSQHALRIGGSAAEPVLMKYGELLQATVDFLVVAFCVFLLVKAINVIRKPAPVEVPESPADVRLLTEIRDLLERRS